VAEVDGLGGQANEKGMDAAGWKTGSGTRGGTNVGAKPVLYDAIAARLATLASWRCSPLRRKIR
jgi:hypothetical protein